MGKSTVLGAVLLICLASFVCTGLLSDGSDGESFTLEWKYAPVEDKTLDIHVGDDVTLKFMSTGYGGTRMQYTVQNRPVWLSQSGAATSPVLSGTANAPGTYHANVLWERVDNGTVGASKVICVTINVTAVTYGHTVVYSGNGNTGGSVADTVVTDQNSSHSPVTLAPNGFVRSGHTFAGWLVDGTLYQPGQTVSVGADSSLTATAQWVQNSLTINSVPVQYGVAGQSITFTVSSSSDPSTAVSYQSNVPSVNNGTGTMNISISGNSVTCSATAAGTYQFTLTASSNNYPSSSTTVAVQFAPLLQFMNTPQAGALNS